MTLRLAGWAGPLLAMLLGSVAAAQAPTAPPDPQAPTAPPDPEDPPPGPPPDAWQPRGGVDLVALDKVTARPTRLSGRVGEEIHYGSLTILARSCVVRPPGVSPDAAAFLEVTDSREGVAPFRGWMLLSAPSVSIYEHPVYDIRVAGCRP